uniref:TROVE domain-containing protein n=1 Tax=Gongylonema pulchrum TaxID=637853 RepID=A0A183EX37_9BILA
LEFAFYEAFQNVQPTNKRYCLAVDVSGSMDYQIRNSCLTCSEAAAALSMAIIRTEPHVTSVAFSEELIPLDWRKDMNLSEVMESAAKITMGATDCAQPMLWAEENKKQFDVFIIYTDNETWFGEVHPFEALQQYRKRMGIPDAKLIVMGMISTDFSIADPSDPNMLDICGFDSSVPQLISEFVLGNIS